MNEISPDDRFVTAEGMDLNEVPDGYVIYDNDNNMVHYLNSTAAIVYQMCDGGQSVAAIAEFIKSAFELDEDIDVQKSMQDMLEAGLICKAE